MIKSLESKGSNEEDIQSEALVNNDIQGGTLEIENILEDINTQDLEDKIIVIDEAHNLFNSISNGSKIANEFYEIIMNTKKIKLIFGSCKSLHIYVTEKGSMLKVVSVGD